MLSPRDDHYHAVSFIVLGCGMKLFKDDIVGTMSSLWTVTAMVFAIGGLVVLIISARENNCGADGCPEQDIDECITRFSSLDTNRHENCTCWEGDGTICDDTGIADTYQQVPSTMDRQTRVRVWLRIARASQSGKEGQDGEEMCDCDGHVSA